MRPLLLIAVISALATSSCFSPGDGLAPQLDQLYFPTGVVIDSVSTTQDPTTGVEKPNYLYVASSDFDLQYRSSALASFDLVQLTSALPVSCNSDADCTASGKTCDMSSTDKNGGVPSYFCVAEDVDPCAGLGLHSAPDQLLYPGRCNPIDPKAVTAGGGPILHDTVGIGAFATDIILRPNPDGKNSKARLFLPVRGDASLHWIDLSADGKFSCGQSNTDDDSCDGQHRAGTDQTDNLYQLRQPSEPFGVDATADGENIVITNQTTGSVSLYVNGLDETVGPKLESVIGGLPTAPVAIAALPGPFVPASTPILPDGTSAPSIVVASDDTAVQSPAFLVAYRNAAQIDLLRVRAYDSVPSLDLTDPNRAVLAYAGTTSITANALGFDSRSIAIDTYDRDEDYRRCALLAGCMAGQVCTGPAYDDCATAAVIHQPDVYVANRAPSSLLIGALTPNPNFAAGSSQLPSFTDTVALTTGPSRVVLGKVRVVSTDTKADGYQPNSADPAKPGSALERRVFIVCFDSRRIFIYDPKRRVIEASVITGRGPFALAVDDSRGLAYIAHFTDSYLGVISLDQRFPKSYASIIASVGTPSPPRASK